LHDSLITTAGLTIDEARSIQPVVSEGIIKRADPPLSQAYHAAMSAARALFPRKLDDVMTSQDSPHQTFVHNIHSVALSQGLGIPLISSVSSEVECVLIRRALTTETAATVLESTYGEPLSEVRPVLDRILNLQGFGGMIVSPISLDWLKTVVERDVQSLSDMLTVALELRRRFAKVRSYLAELSATLCDPIGSVGSYNRATKKISELKRALLDIAEPGGDRVFLLRAPDVTSLVPSIGGLVKATSGVAAILREVGGKQASWLARRLRYRPAFQLFASFDRFVNGRGIGTVINQFFMHQLHKSQLGWLTSRAYELKNISRLKLLSDDEDPHWVIGSG
jgi:hypothetical protein